MRNINVNSPGVVGWCPKHPGSSFLDCHQCKMEKPFVYGELTIKDLEEAFKYILENSEKKRKGERVFVWSSYCKTAGGLVRRGGVFTDGICGDKSCVHCNMISEALKKEVEKLKK